MAGRLPPAFVAVLPPKPRIESLSDLIFGLALSIGALALIAQPVLTAGDLLRDLLDFAFGFIVLIVVWVRYTVQHDLFDDRDARGLAPQPPHVVLGCNRTVPVQPRLRFADSSASRPNAGEPRVRGVCGGFDAPDGSPGELRAARFEEPFDRAGLRDRGQLSPVPEHSPARRWSLPRLCAAEPGVGTDARLVHPA